MNGGRNLFHRALVTPGVPERGPLNFPRVKPALPLLRAGRRRFVWPAHEVQSRAGLAGTLDHMPQLVLLRHGQSQWNADNLFTGWYDVDLTRKGEDEARQSGRLLADHAELDLRVLHTSLLVRAIRTADLALDVAGRAWLPVRRHWRLNERHYGALQGLDKKETAAVTAKPRSRSGAGATPLPRRRSSRGAPTIRPAIPATAMSPRSCCRPASAWPTWSTGSCPTGTTSSCPTCWPRGRGAGRYWWWPTATASEPSASTSTPSGTTTIVDLDIPTGIPFRLPTWRDDLSVVVAGDYLGACGTRRRRPPPRPPAAQAR